ncbi:MAG: hypothetical protein AAF709_09085 [Pseudomonadota bacterium]
MTTALSRLLTVFDGDAVEPEVVAGLEDSGNGESALQLVENTNSSVVESFGSGGPAHYSIVQSAYRAGIEKGQSHSEELMAQVREEAHEAAQAEIAAERQRLLTETLEPIANQLSEAYAQLGDAIERGVAEALAPLINEEIKRQALGSLKTCMEELMESKAGCLVRISAPEELVEELAQNLAPLADVANITPCDGTDIEVKIDDTILNVQLSQLQQAMQEMVN